MNEVALIGAGFHPWGKLKARHFLIGNRGHKERAQRCRNGVDGYTSAGVGSLVFAGNTGTNPGQSLAAVMGETGIPSRTSEHVRNGDVRVPDGRTMCCVW